MTTVTTQSLALDKLPVNWFDMAVLLILALGLFRGRKNGMTKEVLRVFQWLAVVIVCGLFYETAAQAVGNIAAWNKPTSYVTGYLILAFMVWIVFAVLKRIFVPRLTGSNVFGGGEYYLGMFSGMIRFACMVLFALALLNAPVYTQAEILAHQAYAKRWFGGGVYGGNYIPDLHTVQDSVFKKSFAGPYIKGYLGTLLINTAPPEAQKAVAKTGVITIRQ
ncbi:MAG: CvpA family protein [Verrucomicrobiia bacterium]